MADRIDDWEHDIKECCGVLGLRRWAGHLLRDAQQQKARPSIMNAMDIYSCYTDDDFWAKVSRMKQNVKKDEAYADSKISVHGTAVCIKVPPRDTPNIDWKNFPKVSRHVWLPVAISAPLAMRIPPPLPIPPAHVTAHPSAWPTCTRHVRLPTRSSHEAEVK